MTRDEAVKYTSVILDDAGMGMWTDDKLFAPEKLSPKARFVGWQCGFEPYVIAVQSYLDVRLEDNEAKEIAIDWLEEKGWFGNDEEKEPDFII